MKITFAVLLTTILMLFFFQQQVANLFINKELIDRLPFLELDSTLGWKNKRGFDQKWPLTQSNELKFTTYRYRINASGERVSNFYQENPIVRPKSVVWVLGDSSPFGFGVHEERVFVERLKQQFHQKSVLFKNFSVVGYNMGQIYKDFRQRLKNEKQTPEVVILWGGFNDVEFTSRLFWGLLSIPGLRFWNFEREVSRFLNLAETEKITVIANTLPTLESSEPLEQVSEWLKREKQKRTNFFVNDIREEFKKRNSPILYSDIDYRLPKKLHPSEKGHEIIAERLAEFFAPHQRGN